ncbi:hypothetical protein RI129_002605 [Pyrocoelia pectoralis]|uniref:Helix-turn-helix domain-containing protein n=1 Tax=Pyrocoelia pectoralis TaxID=417401 RepID=A0AAN7VN95_9COLE
MEEFEQNALNTATLKPKCWFRYVDDTFVIWPHGSHTLDEFLQHLNNIHPNIKFTMETESNNELSFLDTLIRKRVDGKFNFSLYRKPTHSNRYLNASSHHHPSQLNAVIKSLIIRSLRLTDDDSREEELTNIKMALQQNGYSSNQINKIIKDCNNFTKKPTTENELKKPLILPYIKGVTDVIAKKFPNDKFRKIFKPFITIQQLLRNAKDHIPGENQGIYEIPCSGCCRSYIGQTNRRLNIRAQEHNLAIKQFNTSSSLACHRMDTGHQINTSNIKLLATAYTLNERIIREAIEIEKRPLALNKRDDTSRISPIWKIIINKQDTPSQRITTNTNSNDHPTIPTTSSVQNIQNIQTPTFKGPMTRSRTRIDTSIIKN